MVKKLELNQLNLFRGLAALYVFVGHCAHITQTDLLIPGPGHAVDFFMLMSGFLMALNFHHRKLKEPWEKSSTIIRFYIRRFFRIAPVYFLFFFIAYFFYVELNTLSNMTIDNPNPLPFEVTTQKFLLGIFLHLTFLFGLFPDFVQDNVLPDWSIGLEMQFYFVFPFLMLIFRKVGRISPIILCTILYLSSNYLFGNFEQPGELLHFGQPAFLPMKINVFILGVLLGEAKFYIDTNNQSKALSLLGLTLILCFIGNNLIIIGFTLYFIIWIFSMLKVSPLFLSKFFTILENKLKMNFIKFLADTSYSVYLSHLVVLYCVNAVFINYEVYYKINTSLWFICLFFVCLPIIYFVSHLVFNYVEKPFIKIGKKFII